MKDKILITGGTGFVGRHLQEELTRRGIPHYVFSSRDYDLAGADADDVFAAHRDAEAIIHLASYQAAAEFPAKHTAEQFYINNRIHLNVLEGWRKHIPSAKLFAIGCSCAYPSAATAMSESELMDGDIHGSVYSYGFTKRLLATGIRAYNDQYGLNGSYLIPATLFGEFDDFHIDTAHVCGALIGKFVRAVHDGLPDVEIWGDGSQVREFMYVKDFVRALLHLIPLCDKDVVNVGPGTGTSIRDLANAINQAVGFQGRLMFNDSRYVGVKEKVMNASKLEKKYHWNVSSKLAGGIARTVEWYWRNYDQLQETRKFSYARAE